MTATRPAHLHCDFLDCEEVYTPGVDGAEEVREARKVAAKTGWSHKMNLDLCPKHTAALFGKKAKVVANGPEITRTTPATATKDGAA